jgi:hypothetical protein
MKCHVPDWRGIGSHPRLKVFENRMRKRIFRTKKKAVIGGRRELHNEELHTYYTFHQVLLRSKD